MSTLKVLFEQLPKPLYDEFEMFAQMHLGHMLWKIRFTNGAGKQLPLGVEKYLGKYGYIAWYKEAHASNRPNLDIYSWILFAKCSQSYTAYTPYGDKIQGWHVLPDFNILLEYDRKLVAPYSRLVRQHKLSTAHKQFKSCGWTNLGYYSQGKRDVCVTYLRAKLEKSISSCVCLPRQLGNPKFQAEINDFIDKAMMKLCSGTSEFISKSEHYRFVESWAFFLYGEESWITWQEMIPYLLWRI